MVEKTKRKRKSVPATEKVETAKEAKPTQPVQAELSLDPVITRLPVNLHKVVVAMDDSEYRLIQTYVKKYNDERATVAGFYPVNESQYLLLGTLRWIECLERSESEEGELAGAEDATPTEPTLGVVTYTSIADPVDDDPEFVEAMIGGNP